ncbi:hypothetical protein [Prevotella disiens]|uniref:Uncharacterized protein n=1 Tax=Prevotella disiens TaxID=28130 RepID=A0A3E4QN84_9BACT|nr:hypothetical protein [Prevotella disiens]RGL06776.1 hypothetical protein DXC89_00150 [Prevotella disiens]
MQIVIAFANFAKDNYLCNLPEQAAVGAEFFASSTTRLSVPHKQIMYGVENRNPFAKRHALQRKQVHFTLIGNIFAKTARKSLLFKSR